MVDFSSVAVTGHGTGDWSPWENIELHSQSCPCSKCTYRFGPTYSPPHTILYVPRSEWLRLGMPGNIEEYQRRSSEQLRNFGLQIPVEDGS